MTPAEEPGLRETDPWRKDAEVPLPQFYYWQSTPDSFDFESGQRAASDGHAADLEGTGFHGLPVSSSGNAGGREDGGANQNPEPSGDPLGEGNADNWLFGDGFFRDERSDDSPWTDFLSHHYFFDSLPQDPDSEEYPDGEDDPDYDALGEDLFDFLSEEESEALSPWSEQGSPQDLQGEEDQYLRSPLAGFYEELEEARKEAEGIDADAPGDEDDEDEESAPEAPGKGRPQKSDHDRFEGMPPIEASDLGSVDWDDLLGKLRGDAADPS